MPTLVVTAPGARPLRVVVTAADALVRAALPALFREAGGAVGTDEAAGQTGALRVVPGCEDQTPDVSMGTR